MGDIAPGRKFVHRRVNKCGEADFRMCPDHFEFKKGTGPQITISVFPYFTYHPSSKKKYSFS